MKDNLEAMVSSEISLVLRLHLPFSSRASFDVSNQVTLDGVIVVVDGKQPVFGIHFVHGVFAMFRYRRLERILPGEFLQDDFLCLYKNIRIVSSYLGEKLVQLRAFECGVFGLQHFSCDDFF